MINFAEILRAGQNLIPSMRDEMAQQAQTDVMKAQVLEADRKWQKAIANDQREEDYLREATAVFANPTPDAIASLQARYPDHYEAIKAAWTARDDAARKTDLTQIGSLYNLVRMGNVDRAAKLARQRYEADLAAGVADDDDLSIVEGLESGDPERIARIGGALMLELSIAAGPDKFGSTFQNVGQESRQQDIHPADMRKAIADASTKEAEALAAPGYFDARADRAEAEADIAESDARYRDPKNDAAIKAQRTRARVMERREARQAAGGGGRSGGSKPAPRPKYLQYATGPGGKRLGFNGKTKRWEPVN